ncbi:VPLPA-CTERM sorting domain-containing protein [Litoreibacter sp.]|nr:VPLPA-CTERM sorting domain-containing protein [Litoreibacter sp.]
MKNFAIALGTTLAFALPAQSATVVAFDIPENRTSIAASETANGVTGENLRRASGLKRTGVGTFRAYNWTIGGDADKARRLNNAFTWGFNSTVAYDLTSLDIHYDGSNKGPKSVVLDVFVNGTAYLDVYTDLSVDTRGETHLGIDLSALKNATSVLFRLSGWGATKKKGTLELENIDDGPGIVVHGEVAAPLAIASSDQPVSIASVPLPAGLPLLLGGLGVFAVIRRRS